MDSQVAFTYSLKNCQMLRQQTAQLGGGRACPTINFPKQTGLTMEVMVRPRLWNGDGGDNEEGMNGDCGMLIYLDLPIIIIA